jgi:broad specificity phosphatase PhoE
LLVRHGTTAWVDMHRLHGITDIPLNENGLRQAREAAQVLKSEHAQSLYTSPLIRCRQTAEIIGKEAGLEPRDMAGLKELNFGWLEGRSFRDQSSQKINFLIKLYDNFTHRVIRSLTGESTHNFQQRIMADWNRILHENPQGTVIIVGHSAVFNNILIHYFGKNFPKGHTYYSMAPGSINEILMDDQGKTKLVRLNDTVHLIESKA